MLGVCLIVDHENVEHISDFIKILKSTGVDSVKVSACIVDNDAAKNNRYHAPFFDRVKEQVRQSQEDHAAKKFEIYDAYHELNEKFDKDYTWCPYIQILPVIAADMNVYACHDKAYNLEEGLIGSIMNHGFRDFWLENKDKFFKIDPSRHCQHHCVANERNRLILDYLNAEEEHLGFV